MRNKKRKCRSPSIDTPTHSAELQQWLKEQEIKNLMSHDSYTRNKRGALISRGKVVIK